MCGLSGVMSNSISYNEEAMFKDLLNVSSLRGSEGSGCIISQASVLKRNPAIRAIRTKGISGQLAYSDELNALLKGRINCLIGHARWPTKGGVDIAAVHPHRSGHIIGVHNGTMTRVGGVDVKSDMSDSAMLFDSFARNGVEETIKESDGAYALVWVNEQDQTINFLRNGLRTLYFRNYGWNKNINTMYWASEREMLDFVAPRHYKNDTAWNTYLPVDKWFKYPLDVKHMIVCQETVQDVRPAPKVYSTGGATAHGAGGGTVNHRRMGRELAGLDDPFDSIGVSGMGRNHRPSGWVWDSKEMRFASPDYIKMRDEREARLLAALEEKKNNVIALLPPPEEKEDTTPKALNEATEINYDGLTKKQKARLAKRRAEEEAAAKKRINKFRHPIATNDISTAMAELVSDAAPEEPEPETVFDEPLDDLWQNARAHRDYRGQSENIRCEGEGCAWCGSVACVGDRVLPTGYSDLGGGHLCYDCSRNPDVSPYVQGKQLKTVEL
jgi:hypothetical protein